MRAIIFTILFSALISQVGFSDEWTHQLGNSGYAIREAMNRGASKKSPLHYWKAVKLQEQAKNKLRHENLDEAIRLSRLAFREAKLAYHEASRM